VSEVIKEGLKKGFRGSYIDDVCIFLEYDYNMIKYEYKLNTICYEYTTNRYRVLAPEYNMNPI
jgi:hypothetical protein